MRTAQRKHGLMLETFKLALVHRSAGGKGLGWSPLWTILYRMKAMRSRWKGIWAEKIDALSWKRIWTIDLTMSFFSTSPYCYTLPAAGGLVLSWPMGDHERSWAITRVTGDCVENSGVGGNDRRGGFDAIEQDNSSEHKEFALIGEEF